MSAVESLEDVESCWRDLADVLAAGISRVLLYGPSGTGKTYAALHHGVSSVPAERLVCTEDLTSGEITGTWMPVGRESLGVARGTGDPGVAWERGASEDDSSSTRSTAHRAMRSSTLLAMTDSPESARWRNPETVGVGAARSTLHRSS